MTFLDPDLPEACLFYLLGDGPLRPCGFVLIFLCPTRVDQGQVEGGPQMGTYPSMGVLDATFLLRDF